MHFFVVFVVLPGSFLSFLSRSVDVCDIIPIFRRWTCFVLYCVPGCPLTLLTQGYSMDVDKHGDSLYEKGGFVSLSRSSPEPWEFFFLENSKGETCWEQQKCFRAHQMTVDMWNVDGMGLMRYLINGHGWIFGVRLHHRITWTMGWRSSWSTWANKRYASSWFLYFSKEMSWVGCQRTNGILYGFTAD